MAAGPQQGGGLLTQGAAPQSPQGQPQGRPQQGPSRGALRRPENLKMVDDIEDATARYRTMILNHISGKQGWSFVAPKLSPKKGGSVEQIIVDVLMFGVVHADKTLEGKGVGIPPEAKMEAIKQAGKAVAVLVEKHVGGVKPDSLQKAMDLFLGEYLNYEAMRGGIPQEMVKDKNQQAMLGGMGMMAGGQGEQRPPQAQQPQQPGVMQ